MTQTFLKMSKIPFFIPLFLTLNVSGRSESSLCLPDVMSEVNSFFTMEMFCYEIWDFCFVLQILWKSMSCRYFPMGMCVSRFLIVFSRHKAACGVKVFSSPHRHIMFSFPYRLFIYKIFSSFEDVIFCLSLYMWELCLFLSCGKIFSWQKYYVRDLCITENWYH